MQPQTSPQPTPNTLPATPPIQPQPQPISPTNQTNSPTSKKRIPTWLKIVVIVAILFIGFIVAIVLLAASATKAPQKVSDQFINDVQASNSTAAYALTSSAFQQTTSKEQLGSAIEQVGPVLQGPEKVTGRSIEKTSGSPELAVITYSVKAPDATYYMKVELQENAGQWQVIHFNSSQQPLDTSLE